MNRRDILKHTGLLAAGALAAPVAKAAAKPVPKPVLTCGTCGTNALPVSRDMKSSAASVITTSGGKRLPKKMRCMEKHMQQNG
jgi:hypothetical protein